MSMEEVKLSPEDEAVTGSRNSGFGGCVMLSGFQWLMSRYVVASRLPKICCCSDKDGSMMKVLRSSHQNLCLLVLGAETDRVCLPLGLGILGHSIAYGVGLLPAFSPFMSISLFRAHVCNFEVVAPSFSISLLVPDAVSFDGPFSWPFPLHHASAFVRC